MTVPVKPSKKARTRPKDFALIVASNLGIVLALGLLLAGIIGNSSAVIVAGGVVAGVAFVLYFVHASRRRARMRA